MGFYSDLAVPEVTKRALYVEAVMQLMQERMLVQIPGGGRGRDGDEALILPSCRVGSALLRAWFWFFFGEFKLSVLPPRVCGHYNEQRDYKRR